MILGSHRPKEIGSIVTTRWRDKDRKLQEPQPFYIIREVTYEEYKKYCIEMSADFSDAYISPTDHFYEVSTD